MKAYLIPAIGMALLTGVAPSGAAHAQAKKKPPVKKPAAASQKPKPAPAKGGPIVLGTTQLPGDFGKLGQTYTVGKDTPINFTLKSAEYTTARFNADEYSSIPGKSQKLLVLHYTVHNPLPREQRYYWADLKFTAVDSKDVNHEFTQSVTREGTTERVEVTLKPAQKLEVQTAILVPAAGVVPKLIVSRDDGSPVVRYDLRGKVKPLPAPIADPADPTGATVRKAIPAEANTYYPLGEFDVQFESAAYTTEELRGQSAGDGNRYLTATFRIKNATNTPKRYYWATFTPELRDADGEKVEYPQTLLKATRPEVAEGGDVAPGEEVRFRFFFVLPEKVAGKTLTLTEDAGGDPPTHGYVFDVSGAK
ncbi:MAG TPA: hypothetical protein VM490_21535 [Armatimonadaceae bacterium]|nr:hypothetical protein [Armatimonadaceae bacterium]